MNYSQVGIANMALQRIGARLLISSPTEDSPNAIKVNAVWDMIFQEVMSERDWKFAKTRVQLQRSALIPVGGYCFAYGLPADFLRIVKPRERPEEHRIADANLIGWGWGGGGWGYYRYRDLPVYPKAAAPYIIETVASTATPPQYQTCLLTNYPACECPIILCYIRLLTDLTQLLPGFVNCLAYRLAAELAIPITEDQKKAQGMMEMYRDTLNSAQAQNECDDYLAAEAGSNTWVRAGREYGWGDW